MCEIARKVVVRVEYRSFAEQFGPEVVAAPLHADVINFLLWCNFILNQDRY